MRALLRLLRQFWHTLLLCVAWIAFNFHKNVDDLKTPQIFQALQAHWIWQDQLMWSRNQLLLTIQAATLAATSVLSKMSHGWMMFFLAGIVSLALYRLAELDERDRDNTATLLNCLLITNLPSDAHLRRSSFISYLGSGGGMIRLMIVGFVFLDFLLGTLIMRGWQP